MSICIQDLCKEYNVETVAKEDLAELASSFDLWTVRQAFAWSEPATSTSNVLETCRQKPWNVCNSDSSNASSYARERELAVQLLTSGTQRSVSIYTCPKCKENNVNATESQTRSSDEAATVFCQCKNSDCRHAWRIG